MLLLLSQLLGYGEFVFFNKIIGNMIFFYIFASTKIKTFNESR